MEKLVNKNKPRPKKTVERREDALERLLLAACNLLPDDLSELGDSADLAEKVTGEAVWWIDFASRGVKPVATDPRRRTGAKDVAERRKAYKLVGRNLVPVAKP